MSSKLRLSTINGGSNNNNPHRRQAFLQRSLNDTISENETKEFRELSTRVKLLEKDLERRQESYITRELNYQKRIEALELEILNHRRDKIAFLDVPIATNNYNNNSNNNDSSSSAATSPESQSKIALYKSMQDQIIKNVETVQERAARVIKEQERDLSRAFQARLFDLQAELEREKNKGDDGSFAWIQRCKRLEIELEWAKEVSLKLEQTNQNLNKECERLKSQFVSQEDDRTFLVKQVTAAKKESIRLKAEYAVLEVEVEKLRKEVNEPQSNDSNNNSSTYNNKTTNQRPTINSSSSSNSNNNSNSISNNTLMKLETDEKYKELNTRLRRLLVEERKALQTVRDNYNQELKSRTELEVLLRHCLQDVKRDIMIKATEEEMAVLSASMNHLSSGTGNVRNANSTSRPSSNSGLAVRPGSKAAIHKQRIQAAAQQSLTLLSQSLQQSHSGSGGPTLDSEADRQRFLQSLLSQEKIIKLLYEKSFPTYNNNNTTTTTNDSSNNVTSISDTNNATVVNNRRSSWAAIAVTPPNVVVANEEEEKNNNNKISDSKLQGTTVEKQIIYDI